MSHPNSTSAIDADHQPTPPKALRLLTLLATIAFAITLLGGGWVAVLGAGQLLWVTLAFEVVAVGAVVTGVFAARGQPRQGLGLTLCCVAGSALLTAGFGQYLAARPTVTSAEQAGQAPEGALRVLEGVVVLRVGLAGLFSVLAGLIVLARKPAAYRPLLVGLALLAPVAGISLWIASFGGAQLLVGEIESGLGIVRLIATLFFGLLLFVFGSIGGHYIIRAFETTAEPAAKSSSSNPSEAAAESAASA